jgi:RNA polymerase sigma factor (sigma-70 family)
VPEAATVDAGLRRGEDRDALRRAPTRLPSRQRAVLVLRYLEDLPDTTIAELLGCSPGTVHSQAARRLAALRPVLTAGTARTMREGDTHVG